MLSIPSEPTFVRNTLVWNGLALITALGIIPCLSRNFNIFTENNIRKFGTKFNIFTRLSVLFAVCTSLFF